MKKEKAFWLRRLEEKTAAVANATPGSAGHEALLQSIACAQAHLGKKDMLEGDERVNREAAALPWQHPTLRDCDDATSAAVLAVEAAIAATKAACDAVQRLSETQRRHAGLWDRYTLTAVGSPLWGSATKPIYDPRYVTPQRVFQANPDRAHAREVLRKAKLPEPLIWDRWPPHSAAEKSEMAERLARWRPANGQAPVAPRRPTPPPIDPFEAYVMREARRVAKASGEFPSAVAAKADFRERCKRFYDEILSIDLEIDLGVK